MSFLLYGATGYVGRAVARLAVERGLQPLLAARSEEVRGIADALGLEAMVVSVDDSARLREAVGSRPVVLNCAGPFRHTFRQMVEACLATGTHSVDITGEPVVFEAVAALDEPARRAGVMLLPGAGFDVVATDCLAGHLSRRLPSATRLRLAFTTVGPASLPPGTVRTTLETGPDRSSREFRKDGEVVVARSRPSMRVDFGPVERTVHLHTWGDVYLAHLSTGIGHVEDYLSLPPGAIRALDALERVSWLLRFRPVRELLRSRIPTGATAEERRATTTHVWGEVTDPDGRQAVSRLHGPEAGHDWTALAALSVVRRVLDGDAPPGHRTPSTAYGPDLVFDVEGVVREDVGERA